MPHSTTPFDASDYLETEQEIEAFLQESLDTSIELNDMSIFLTAIGHAAKARGMAQIAKDTGLGRESLYKALSPTAKPRIDTIAKVVTSLGLKFKMVHF
jgi:probable addiction module antidote protein